MGAWTTGVRGGGSVSGGDDRRDLDEEESVEVGTIEPGVDVGTDDPNFTGLVAASVVLPPILRPPPMLKALLKVRWERLLMLEEMEKDDGGLKLMLMVAKGYHPLLLDLDNESEACRARGNNLYGYGG
jgi:hypothetical protein